ncbi:hypothetical protein K2P97_01320 [bacterium]|nr:hypothetical protein [bacterium]
MGINTLLTILFFLIGISVFASDIQFNELIKQSSAQQLQAAADLEEYSQQEDVYLNVQKKQNASTQAQVDTDDNDGLKVVLKKKQKKKKKKKPASVSSPVIVPIKGN